MTQEISKSQNITAVHTQWMNRPDDQRFLTLEELEASVEKRTMASKVDYSDTKTMTFTAADKNALVVNTIAGPKFLTNWSFGQLCQTIHAPAGYLRQLPAALATANIDHGLQVTDREEIMLLSNTDTEELRAITSTTYGRIYDLDVVRSVIKVNESSGGRWVIPAASYEHQNPRRATTLYASDRDVFIFLCDPKNPVIVDGKELFRGFYTWNSEVGSKIFGLATFLYNRVCDNRIIWGAEQFQEVKIKHTSGAPERFLKEGAPMLLEYANASASQIEEKIQRAQNIKLGKDSEEVSDFLRKFGFSQAMATSVIETAKQEEGRFKSAWAIAQGITAKARTIEHTDLRVDLEKQAGKLLDKVLGK